MSQGQVFVGAGTWTSQKKQGGLFRQAAGNGHWETVTKGLPDPMSVQAITFHPTEADVIYVGTQDGPYRSTDGGRSFERPAKFPAGLQVWSITVHPKNPKTIYAGTSPVGVYRSDDGGTTWRELPNVKQPDRIKMSFACRTMRIAVVPGASEQIFAALEVGGVMRSLRSASAWASSRRWSGGSSVTGAPRPRARSRRCAG